MIVGHLAAQKIQQRVNRGSQRVAFGFRLIIAADRHVVGARDVELQDGGVSEVDGHLVHYC